MTEIIRSFEKTQLRDTLIPQRGLMHPVAAALQKMVKRIALEVYQNWQNST